MNLDIEWRKDGEVVRMRLVAPWNPDKGEHLLLVTNLQREPFDTATVLTLYRLRWQVELLFKEWKSYANLHSFSTRNAAIAEGLIWAALAAALIKRFFAHATEFVFSTVAISTRCTSMALSYHMPRLMEAIIRGRGATNRFRELLQFLENNAARAHPKRDKITGRLQAGLRHFWAAECPA